MAAVNMPATCFFVLVQLVILLQCITTVYCSEFDVGERVGWAVPPSNDTGMYNKWASSKRFNVGDTLRFKYERDSVVEVDEEGYKECDVTRPQFFSNTGDTTFKLDHRSGFFYFISGTMGHCEKGQRMIVWVMSRDNNAGNSPPDNKDPSNVSNGGYYNGAYDIFFFSVPVILGHLVMSVFQLV